MRSVSCIIPAYNESSTLANTILAARRCPAISEIIVVNDGSTDRTGEILTLYPFVHVISFTRNRGKSAALAAGLASASSELICLMDADLVGLTETNVSELLDPVLRGEVDVTLSMRKNSLAFYRHLGLDFVSGERVFPKRLLENKIESVASLPRYGFEVYLNDIIIREGLRVRTVWWNNVHMRRKVEKVGLVKGVWAEFRMVMSIVAEIAPWRVAWQISQLRKLSRGA